MVDRAEQTADIIRAIRTGSKRVTEAKRTVADVLMEATNHLTADELTQEVQKRQPDVSPSTVYRILDEFGDLGIVEHSHFDQHAAVYHLIGPVHGHLTCEQCAATFEIPASHFDALGAELLRDYGFDIDRHHVAVSGTCARCRELRPTQT